MDPVSGAWVVLHRVGPDRAGPLDSLQSDSRGRYSFSYQRTGSEDAVYFVSASHDGIAYFTPPLAEGKVSGDDGEITVFDTTSGHVPMSLRGHHVVVSAVDANARRAVMEVYDLSNDSSVTRIATGDKPEDATWQVHLTPGATDFQVSQGDISAAAVAYANGVVERLRADCSRHQAAVVHVFAAGERVSAEAAAREGDRRLRDTDRGESGQRDRAAPQGSRPGDGRGAQFPSIPRSDMPENSVAVIDLPAPPPTRSIDPRFLVALTVVIGGSMIVALARALRRG